MGVAEPMLLKSWSVRVKVSLFLIVVDVLVKVAVGGVHVAAVV